MDAVSKQGEILQSLARLEAEIQQGMKELEAMLENSTPKR